MKKLWMIAVLAFVASTAHADDKPKDDAPPRSLKPIPLRVQVVFQTRVDDKNRSRIPYEFTCLANSPPTGLRIGTEVPIAVSKQTKEGEKTDWQYRNVGTNIRCDAQSLEEGRYRVSLLFEQSSIHSGAKPQGTQAAEVPLFNTWNLNSGDIFRDGQTIQSALGTDPNTGETATLDVTVKLMK